MPSRGLMPGIMITIMAADFGQGAFTEIEGDCLEISVSMNVPVKPIDSWSRGIHRRLVVEPTFESLHPTL
ncbi:unnamed protein product [Protopolystoma xenopodis]|uniref:Uncharacterized protein n=1 Tax=Protopolystoma xenopodis TaxID=117903 RepID=A0A3S5BLV8_9PLAT|nr:unnamed protein product [Protopolystoma xenopodis]